MKTRVVSSWSGGKDCCLALYRSIQRGYITAFLYNLVSENLGRCCFHGIESGLLRLQAGLIGIPLVQKIARDDMHEYEKDFKDGISQLAGVRGIVFGDIYLDEHKDWVERVCQDMNLEAIEPLWNENPSKLLAEFIDEGFEAIVVSCQAEKFDKDFVGRRVDKRMMHELEARGICPCGENGEFHTLVINGPIFKRGINIINAKPLLKDGFWKHWVLDIKEYN
jgi:diphthine-ammonia ligase